MSDNSRVNSWCCSTRAPPQKSKHFNGNNKVLRAAYTSSKRPLVRDRHSGKQNLGKEIPKICCQLTAHPISSLQCNQSWWRRDMTGCLPIRSAQRRPDNRLSKSTGVGTVDKQFSDTRVEPSADSGLIHDTIHFRLRVDSGKLLWWHVSEHGHVIWRWLRRKVRPSSVNRP